MGVARHVGCASTLRRASRRPRAPWTSRGARRGPPKAQPASRGAAPPSPVPRRPATPWPVLPTTCRRRFSQTVPSPPGPSRASGGAQARGPRPPRASPLSPAPGRRGSRTARRVVYAALESRMRTALKEHAAPLPDHKGQRLQHPTARWVFHSFVGIHVLFIPGQGLMVLNLTDEPLHLLQLLGKRYVLFYR